LHPASKIDPLPIRKRAFCKINCMGMDIGAPSHLQEGFLANLCVRLQICLCGNPRSHMRKRLISQ